jgi:hypothetical protein
MNDALITLHRRASTKQKKLTADMGIPCKGSSVMWPYTSEELRISGNKFVAMSKYLQSDKK